MRRWRKTGLSRALVLLMLLAARLAYGQADPSPDSSEIRGKSIKQELDQIRLQTLDRKAYSLSRLHKKLLAIVFLSPECPLCQNYTLVLNRLYGRFGGDMEILGVFPGRSNSTAEYRAFQAKYKIPFLLLTDDSKSLVKLLGASITPEVFLFDQNRQVLYHGAIDNRVAALGKQRNRATENYLEDGIEEQLQGVAVKVKEVKPIGCFINEY